MDDSRLYHAIPHWLEKITASRDWDSEIQLIKQILPDDIDVWEWGCRTGFIGEKLVSTIRWFGGESNPHYFELAQLKHGHRVYSHALPEKKVPIIFSWFSPLYEIPPDALETKVSALLAALTPDGVCVLEGGVKPSYVRSRYSMMDTFDGESEKIVRTCVPVLEGKKITFEYYWMYAQDGSPNVEDHLETQIYYIHSDAEVITCVEGLGGYVELRDVRGTRLWFLSHKRDSIDGLFLTL